LISRETGKAEADYVALQGEIDVQQGKKLKLFDKLHPYLNKFVENYETVALLRPIFVGGKLVYELPALKQIRRYHLEQLDLFWPEYLRKLNPAVYTVDLSVKAWKQKMDLIHDYTKD
jgi:nicotinate phosphoribosyltransferase